MAYLINIEKNVIIDLELEKNIEMGNSSHETWIPSFIKIHSETKNIEIGENVNFALNMYEVKQLLTGINNLISCFEKRENCSFSFCNIESNFELKFDNILEDEVIEIELWVNVANQTKGHICGYDEGIRFIVDKKVVQKFVNTINEEVINMNK